MECAFKVTEQGAQVRCFQELFYGSYFCQVQRPEFFTYTEPNHRSRFDSINRSEQVVFRTYFKIGLCTAAHRVPTEKPVL
jgi:predicted amidohydrolase